MEPSKLGQILKLDSVFFTNSFGDTVNTASRMTTHGEMRRVHMSNSAAELLKNFPELTTTERGVINIKGKFEMLTFWLNMN